LTGSAPFANDTPSPLPGFDGTMTNSAANIRRRWLNAMHWRLMP
jgi:hypothetical protein